MKLKAIVFDLFHTLTGFESEWSDLPRTCDVLGIDRRIWNGAITTGSRWRLAGEERDAYRILSRLAREIDPRITDETIRRAAGMRSQRFRDALQRIPPANVETLRALRRAGSASGSSATPTPAKSRHGRIARSRDCSIRKSSPAMSAT